MTAACLECGEPVKRNDCKFCSCSCALRTRHRNRTRQVHVLVCPQCGGSFEVPPKEFNRGRKFCSHSCAIQFHQPEHFITPSARKAGADKRRGTGTADWYIKRDGRHEHRTVAEQKIGRALLPGEVVHHRNENKKDNAPDNLDVLPSQAEHARLHFTGMKREPKTVCKFGHPFTDENTRTDPNGRRRCLTCVRSYDAAWKRQKRREKRGIYK